MANTTNFNWETPDDTDLVKDGAAAIRTLGSAIDTSLVDLKGGTTGQVLSKATNTDMDFTWVAQDDSNAIQNAIIDAKGDLIVGTAADTPGRLAVGTNNYVLTADSAEATGMKWAALATGTTFVGCSLYKNANQTVNNATNTAITFQSESYDTDGFHDTSTNTSRITIPAGKGGKYLLTGSIGMSTGANEREISVWKNGTKFNIMSQLYAQNLGGFYNGFCYVISLVAGDYVELYMNQGSGGSLTVYNGQDTTSFQASYLGA